MVTPTAAAAPAAAEEEEGNDEEELDGKCPMVVTIGLCPGICGYIEREDSVDMCIEPPIMSSTIMQHNKCRIACC
jgi:hypothetical protein